MNSTPLTQQDLLDQSRRLAPRSERPLSDKGIITLADCNYFPGLMLLHQSVQESWPVPVACFDLGLTDDQRAEASAIDNLTILPLPDIPLIRMIRSEFSNAPRLAKAHKRVWPLWICPALIISAPFRRVFWFDCDIAVLRNLAGLFELLDQGPVFTPENNAPEVTPNKPELYDLLPIQGEFDRNSPAVNAGVSGWDLQRDQDLLAAYIHPVFQACNNPLVREAISWHDQGALIWAIQQCGMEHRVLETPAWNLCIRHSAVVKKQPPWGEAFLQTIREIESDANVLHWNGAKMPWVT